MEIVNAERARPADRLEHTSSNRRSVFGALDRGYEERELVAADAGHGIAVARNACQVRADHLEKLVAGGVTGGIVDQREAIEAQIY